jgi:hypothetical protein
MVSGAGLLRIRVLEEGRDRSRRSCDNDDGPELERDVKRTADGSDRIFQLGGNRQQLHGREEERLTDRLRLGSVGVPLEEVDGCRGADIDDRGRGHD